MAAIEFRVGDVAEQEAALAERVHAFNAEATGYHDGESFAATRADGDGRLEAGICGYTWGGCCFVSYLWVTQTLRGQGLGSELLRTVEDHARQRHCQLVLLSSHSFQAPAFYARHGYGEIAQVADHPVGHRNLFFAKRLDAR